MEECNSKKEKEERRHEEEFKRNVLRILLKLAPAAEGNCLTLIFWDWWPHDAFCFSKYWWAAWHNSSWMHQKCRAPLNPFPAPANSNGTLHKPILAGMSSAWGLKWGLWVNVKMERCQRAQESFQLQQDQSETQILWSISREEGPCITHWKHIWHWF